MKKLPIGTVFRYPKGSLSFYAEYLGKIGIIIGHDNDSAYKIVCPQVDMRPYSSTAGMNEQNAVEVLEANKFLSFIFGIK